MRPNRLNASFHHTSPAQVGNASDQRVCVVAPADSTEFFGDHCADRLVRSGL